MGSFLQPIPLCLSLLLLGLFFLVFTRKKKTGKILVGIGTLVIAIFSHGATSVVLVKPLERIYPPISAFEELKNIKWIVVLGGGCTSDASLPANSQLSDASLSRLVEGIRIYKNLLPQSQLILSGTSGIVDQIPVARVMADTARLLGINEEHLIIEDESKDTKDHPRFIQKIVENERFILVTSASHMRRSIAFFKKHGMNPIPAPTDYLIKERQGGISPGMFFPGADGLRKAERAVHECLGLAWAKIRGQI